MSIRADMCQPHSLAQFYSSPFQLEVNVFGALLDAHSSPAGRGCPARERAADSGGESGWCRFAHFAAGPVCDDIRAMSGWAVGRAQEAQTHLGLSRVTGRARGPLPTT